jgi:hypothetical protein
LKAITERRRAAARIDGIVVPSARPIDFLRTALRTAEALGCSLVVLCSRKVTAAEVIGAARGKNVSTVAVDIVDDDPAPGLATTRLLAGTRFEVSTDISVKRNIGMAVARMSGWESVLFLDDDIDIEHPEHVLDAASILDEYDMVGLANKGYPDNSVVCHARRDVGLDQDTFVGGGALLVPPQRTSSFFPHIYNDDWFFLLGQYGLNSVTLVGAVEQQPYDPYDPDRSKTQEFGDCLAEGVFALLDDNKPVSAADHHYWDAFLDERRQLIDEVIAAVRNPQFDKPGQREQMHDALHAALLCHQAVSPDLCVDYLRAWQSDRSQWLGFLNGLPTFGDPVKALAWLGLRVATSAAASA